MAEATVMQPSSIGSDVKGQTRYLFHRYVHEVTRDSGSTLNSRAFQEMNFMEPRLLFGPDVDETLDELVGCLMKHAHSIKNDVRLQEILEQVKQHFNKDTLWDLCKKIFTNVDDIWTALLTLFAFGLELCRQVATVLYETVVDTITDAVMKWASTWLVNKGGWLAIVAESGILTGMMEAVTSWITWMTPSFLTRTTATSQSASKNDTPENGASETASKDDASETAPKDEAPETASKNEASGNGAPETASKDEASESAASPTAFKDAATENGALESLSKGGTYETLAKDGACESASKDVTKMD